MTLYLKYRPIDFESLVGQDFIKNTLRQAIVQDKLVGAYLFCGPRGTGKTSTARIFAKAMNCLNPKDGNPCNQCEICQSFNNESLVDIIEIDAASYTGVDNIRDIIERAQFSPTKSKYKVYIIDEVHMLSKGAFNALLKILEEPPAHLKFILATTEVHKVPETILSRCQRYDFKLITQKDVTSRLKEIAQKEGITIDDESLNFIHKESKGALRNAISLFEQLVVGNKISYDDVISNYGIPRTDIIQDMYQKLFSGDVSLISDFDDYLGNYNIDLFFKELLFYIKDQIILSLEDKTTLQKNIFLLETLEEVYSKAKFAFDSKTMYLVGVVKCVKNIHPFTSVSSSPFLPLVSAEGMVKKEKKQILKTTPIVSNTTPSEINGDDLLDVFGTNQETQENNISGNEMGDEGETFHSTQFIDILKKIGAKGALTMSLRASSLHFDGKKLTIFTKTKMALKQISSSDNYALMTQAGSQMGYDLQIEIK